MALRDIFGRSKDGEDEFMSEDEYIELDVPQATATSASGKILIQVDKLEDYADSDRIQKKVRDGNIVLVRIRELKEKDIGELKRSIARIRKTCVAVNGDIAGVADDWIVVTPSFARVHREKSAEPVASGPAAMRRPEPLNPGYNEE